MPTFDVTKTQKEPGKIYFGVAIPAAGAEVTLEADGSPDLTENPNAQLVGLTEKGSTCSITKTVTDEYFDEFEEPLEQNVEQVGMSIKAEAAQIMDFDLLEMATVGAGTRADKVGKEKITIGGGATLDYTGICVIFPQKADTTKYACFHIYKGFNNSNVDFAIARQERSKISLEFKGMGIPGRAAADRLGAMWRETIS